MRFGIMAVLLLVQELDCYGEIDDYLGFVNRMVRDLGDR
jgi:hypothetical protein